MPSWFSAAVSQLPPSSGSSPGLPCLRPGFQPTFDLLNTTPSRQPLLDSLGHGGPRLRPVLNRLNGPILNGHDSPRLPPQWHETSLMGSPSRPTSMAPSSMAPTSASLLSSMASPNWHVLDDLSSRPSSKGRRRVPDLVSPWFRPSGLRLQLQAPEVGCLLHGRPRQKYSILFPSCSQLNPNSISTVSVPPMLSSPLSTRLPTSLPPAAKPAPTPSLRTLPLLWLLPPLLRRETQERRMKQIQCTWKQQMFVEGSWHLGEDVHYLDPPPPFC